MKKVTLSAAEFAARMAVGLQDVNKMQYVAYENEQGELVFPAPSPTYEVGKMDSAGRLRLGSATGQVGTVEANSAAIATDVEIMTYSSRLARDAYFSLVGESGNPSSNARKRLFQTAVTATGAGEVVAVNVGPPALAGYQPCMRITHVWSDQTTANMTFTCAPTAGALEVGLATTDISSTADLVAPDWHEGLVWQGDTDASTLQCAAAIGQCGAAQIVVFCGEYWYET